MILYIDPGTGSMLITIVISLLGTALYFLRNLFMKLKFFAKGEKVDKNADKIPLVIYSDHKRYWNVFEPICDELEKREIDTVFMTQSEDDPALDKEYKHIKAEFIGEGSKGFAKLNNLNAKVVLSTTPSLDVFQWKRSKNVNYYIHIPHAPDDMATYKMFALDYYDAVLVSGKHQEKLVRKLEDIRKLPAKDIEIVGMPYLDVMSERVKLEKKNGSANRTVLLSPSWGENGILRKYGSDLIDLLIATGYKIIIRPHPQSYTADKECIDELKAKYKESDLLKWNRDNDNFNVLNESDIMISDFSGIIFEYALVFDKPVIYTKSEFDKSTFDCAWFEEDPWMFTTLPKVGKELLESDFDNIKQTIDECINSKEYSDNRNSVREETWMHINEGSVRVVDYLEKTIINMENKDLLDDSLQEDDYIVVQKETENSNVLDSEEKEDK